MPSFTQKSFAVLLMAAGASRRFADPFLKKTFVQLANRPVWMHSAERFSSRSEVKQVILVISPDDQEMFLGKYAANIAFLELDWVLGGRERYDSVANGLKKVRPEIEYVAVHDAARPCVSPLWIDEVFQAAIETEAAILAAPITGTIKRAEKSENSQIVIRETVSRENLWEAQTPQVFRRTLLEEAYAKRGDFPATDDAQLVHNLGHPVRIVPADATNIKITTKADLKLAERILPGIRGGAGGWGLGIGE